MLKCDQYKLGIHKLLLLLFIIIIIIIIIISYMIKLMI